MCVHPCQLQSTCHAHAMSDRNSKRLNRQPEATNCHLKQSHTHIHTSKYTLTHPHIHSHILANTHTHLQRHSYLYLYFAKFCCNLCQVQLEGKGRGVGPGTGCSCLSCSLRHVQQFDTQFKCRICCCNRLSACCVFKAHLHAERGGGGRAGAWQKGKRGVGVGVITNTPTRQLAAAKKCEMQDTQ